MSSVQRPNPDEVEHLLRNAQLRDEMEPYLDEAVLHLNQDEVPTPVENEFLASMLAWEKAPILPISQWFTPELNLPSPDKLDDADLHGVLWDTIQKLFDKRIVLDFTDHLTDRDLYCLICARHSPLAGKKNRQLFQLSCTGIAPTPAATPNCGSAITPRRKSASSGATISAACCRSTKSRRTRAICRASRIELF